MRGRAAFRGVPDFGDYVVRERLNQLLDSGGNRLRLLAAPSGWGKTIAALQFAASFSGDVVWVEALGQPLKPEYVASEILNYFLTLAGEGREDSRHLRSLDDLLSACESTALMLGRDSRVLVVVDDFGSAEPSVWTALRWMNRTLCPHGVLLLVTTRTMGTAVAWSWPDTLCIGRQELALRDEEAVDLVKLAGIEAREVTERVNNASAGHPALADLMAKAIENARVGRADDVVIPASRWIDRAVGDCLSENDVEHLRLAALLKRGTTSQLIELGVPDPCSLLEKAKSRIPLLRLSEPRADGVREFVVHDIAETWLLASYDASCAGPPPMLWKMLGSEGDLVRAGNLVARFADEKSCLGWLGQHANDMLAMGQPSCLAEILAGIGLQALIERPNLLVAWAAALLKTDDAEEALGRARAAAELTRHEGDAAGCFEATLVWIEALRMLERFDDAAGVAHGLCKSLGGQRDDLSKVRALVVLARVCCHMGALSEAADAAEQAVDGCAKLVGHEAHIADVGRIAAMVEVLATGRYMEAVGRFAQIVLESDSWLSDRVVSRGNLAQILVECGRLKRATPLLDYVMAFGSEYMKSAFAMVASQISMAKGETEAAFELSECALAASLAAGCEHEFAVNRVYLAVMQRAIGDIDGALTSAERAYERLTVTDFMGCRRLAAIEIAASLLALDDVAAARKWTEPLVAAGFDGNAYHALRAAMVLAECDRRSGRLDDAVTRLAEHREHIESESSNWQMAMYVRTFPHLLGMLALAVGADELPVHMLRMVLPEHAERALAASRPWLDPGTWECLGRRVLGDVNFNQLEARGGRPICRVRMFGGLEVAVADRTLCERDWKKRKARLIFAMLVSERGRDIPREQFYEHLWPEMPEERARNNFYVAWSAMKGALMGQSSRSVACPYVENTGGRCRTVTSAVRSDVDEFEEALAEGRAAEVAGDDAAALAAYARLSSVYRGDLLPGDVYDDWFAAARDRYKFDFVDAMVRAAEMLLENDDPCQAIVFSRRALAVDGLREDLYQITLRCHIAAGQRSGAIDTFIQCRTQLSEELGLDPSGATMDLYQQILVMEDCPRYDDYGLS